LLLPLLVGFAIAGGVAGREIGRRFRWGTSGFMTHAGGSMAAGAVIMGGAILLGMAVTDGAFHVDGVIAHLTLIALAIVTCAVGGAAVGFAIGTLCAFLLRAIEVAVPVTPEPDSHQID
jgi:hypothetical protein